MAGLDLWVEKYRPFELDQMVFRSENRELFEEYILNGSIPHLLLAGLPGSGKTTLAKILIEKLPCSYMILNASSKDRSIETMRGKVRTFASSQVPINKKLKVIVLDEADGLLKPAQEALLNDLETYSRTCRFILTANNVSKIIPALKSRCTYFSFTTYPKEEVLHLCQDIIEEEQVDAQVKDIEFIIDKLYPDIRSIVNALQKCSTGKVLNVKSFLSASLSEEVLKEMITSGKVRKLRELWIDSGSFEWIYSFIMNKFINEIPINHRPQIAMIVADYLHRDASIVDKEINITACIVAIMLELNIDIKM